MLNNYYNSPDHRTQKNNRLYGELSNTSYRNDSTQNLPIYTRHTNIPNLTSRTSFNNNLAMRQSTTFNNEQIQNGYKPPSYQQARNNDFQRYVPSPKNHNTSFHNNQNSSKFNSAQNNSNTSNGYIQKKQQNQSFGNKQYSQMLIDCKDTNQKIDILIKAVKYNQKRIGELEKNYGTINNISKISQHQQMHDYKLSIFNQIRSEKQETIRKLRQQISQTRQQLKNYVFSNQIQRIINDKVRQTLEQNKQFPQISSISQLYNVQQIDHVYRQLEQTRNELDEKIKKNFDVLNNIVNRVERDMHNLHLNYPNSNPQYSSSGIKCSGTAILLRFVQCFKVRKNHSIHYIGSKGGEMKITLMDNTYYIDNQGYLLDKDQCYLVDYRGVQVRLQDKHVKMLKQENVLI